MLRVTFTYHSKLLNKTFVNVEMHKSYDDARLRALALNWFITSMEEV